MVLTPIEIIAVVFAVLGLIKIGIIIINVKAWMPVTKTVYGNPKVVSPIVLGLAAIVFYYLIQSLTIVEIVAVMAFTSLIFAIGFLHVGKDLTKMTNKMVKNGLSSWMWGYMLLWSVAMAYVIYGVFF